MYSARFRTRPWNFFQLNSSYFDNEKGIFSKLDIDTLIPEQWRLHQKLDDGVCVPDFPVFRKPEWGQNSHGIDVVRNAVQLREARRTKKAGNVHYLLQEAAKERREFEIFYLRSPSNLHRYEMLSITETVNRGGKFLPVNGVLNKETSYQEITSQLNPGELEKIWDMVQQIGEFKIARVGLHADTLRDVVAGKFHIFEINIFLPMPLILLDSSLGGQQKRKFIKQCMRAAALLARTRDRSVPRYPIFFKQLLAHYQVKY